MSAQKEEESGKSNSKREMLKKIIEERKVIGKSVESKKRTSDENSSEQSIDDSNTVASMKNEVDTLKKKILYLLADQENIKKRTEKEIENAKNFSVSSMAKEMLGVVESLELTIHNIDKSTLEHDSQMASLHNGVSLTLNEILGVLERNGITKIDAKNKAFDHNLHQAVKTIKDESLQNNIIKDVLQEGFMIKNRLLRPSMVVVVNNDE